MEGVNINEHIYTNLKCESNRYGLYNNLRHEMRYEYIPLARDNNIYSI